MGHFAVFHDKKNSSCSKKMLGPKILKNRGSKKKEINGTC